MNKPDQELLDAYTKPTMAFDFLKKDFKKSKGPLFKTSSKATDIKSIDKKTGEVTYLEPTDELVKIIGNFEKEKINK